MHRRASRTRISAKIVKTCDKTGGIAAKIGRTFKGTAANFGKATETCEQTVRMCGKTKGPFVRAGNKCSVINTLGPAPDNSNRTGKIPVATVKISRGIVGMYEAIARIGNEIVMISKPIDGIGIRIGRTFKETVRIGEPTSKRSVAALNIGQVTVDRARFAIRESQTTRGVGDGIPRLSVSSTSITG